MPSEIDLVIPWVDGADPAHAAKRKRYLRGHTCELPSDSMAARRWSDAGELRICLTSIAANAPWARNIWLVTDDQRPRLDDLSLKLRRKIRHIDHRHIFRGFERFLPVFNSLSITTACWRIEGLAEHFVLLNDDTFFSAPLGPEDFFREGWPVLRGKWRDAGEDEGRYARAKTYRSAKLNGATKAGLFNGCYFSLAHVPVALRKSMFERLFERHPDWLASNLSHRFRSNEQFSAPSYLVHEQISAGEVHHPARRDWKNISAHMCRDAGLAQLLKVSAHVLLRRIKLLCVNDLTTLERRYPGARNWLSWLIHRNDIA